MRRILSLLFVSVFVLIVAGPVQTAFGAGDPCTDPDAATDPACLANGSATQLHRFACSYNWVEEACAPTRQEDPGYATNTEPNPTAPLVARIGAGHEHSSYSDGDPEMRPRDYFKAAREGHNTADAGGDTGVKLDFLWGSEHSDNAEIPATTAEVCLSGPEAFASCGNFDENDAYWKWPAALRQARESTTSTFTGMRGFEWTNDVYNHMNVFFSTNFTNVKVDGSYTSMELFWNWLREPVSQGGGADGLVTFNHPGRQPSLTPFDEGMPHNDILASGLGANWNNVAYVPDADDNVAGMEVRPGDDSDDIEFYVKALNNGWHIGAVSAEDEHQREWASSKDAKTVVFTRGQTPKDYYYSLKHHRTMSLGEELIEGAPGTKATFPSLAFFADGKSLNDPTSVPLGSVINRSGKHDLRFTAAGLPAGTRIALVSNRTRGQTAPIQLGAVPATGLVNAKYTVVAPTKGEDWYFVVLCKPGSGACGTNRSFRAVTAPIWLSGS